MAPVGGLHHLELWVEDLEVAGREWGWLLGQLGYTGSGPEANGQSWAHGNFYVFLEAGPARVGGRHDRLRAGLNHVAFHAGSRAHVDAIAAEAPSHGWTLMFVERHPTRAEKSTTPRTWRTRSAARSSWSPTTQ
ncbi:MAG: VOC family protein [Nocardioidaceae bacterium]